MKPFAVPGRCRAMMHPATRTKSPSRRARSSCADRILLRRSDILSAQELRARRDGDFVRVAGCIIARQRPGTAKGFIFISMEDETGIANVIVTPDLYDRDRLVVTRSRFLLVEGPLQNQDNVIHVKATRLTVLSDRALEMRSHDFH